MAKNSYKNTVYQTNILVKLINERRNDSDLSDKTQFKEKSIFYELRCKRK